MKLRFLGNETEELYPVTETERVYQSFEPSAIVAGAGNLESGFGDVELGECADDYVHALVLLEPPEINEQRLLGSLDEIRRKARGIDAIVDHSDRVARNATLDEIVGGAHAHRLERNLPIERAEWPLRQPDGGCKGRGGFAKDRRPEEVMNQGHELWQAPQRSIERNLVQVLDDDVIVVPAEILFEVPPREKRVRTAIPYSVHLDPLEIGALLCPLPRTAEKVDAVTAGSQSCEDLPEVKLGAASLRVFVVLPVEYEYPH